jgi:hypothetical protein
MVPGAEVAVGAAIESGAGGLGDELRPGWTQPHHDDAARRRLGHGVELPLVAPDDAVVADVGAVVLVLDEPFLAVVVVVAGCCAGTTCGG